MRSERSTADIRILTSSLYRPILVSHHPDVIAFGSFTIALALRWSVDRKEAITAGAEVADRFGLDLKYKEKGAEGKDLAAVHGEHSVELYADSSILGRLSK